MLSVDQKSKWEIPPEVVENDKAKVLWDFQIQTDKLQKEAAVIDVVVPSGCNMKKKEHEKIEEYQGLKEEAGKMWEVKAAVEP